MIGSLDDVVYLVDQDNALEWDRNSSHQQVLEKANEQNKKVQVLVDEAKKFSVPLAHAFLNSFKKNYGDVNKGINQAFEKNQYKKGLGLLLNEAEKVDNTNIMEKIKLLIKAFSTNNVKDEIRGDLSIRGATGLMLLEAASKYTKEELQSEKEIFGKLYEEIEMDMRGTISIFGDKASIQCGEAKSSRQGENRGKKQLKIRLQFLKYCVETLFPKVEVVILPATCS